MAKKKLFKSKSNFTLRRLHQSGNYGNIYERDYMTIINTGTAPEGQIPVYNSPSFKLSVRSGYNGKKKYKYGEWLENPGECGGNFWTLSCMPVSNSKSSRIILKPHTHRLTDFACYGSARLLIDSTINNIIRAYPGELYVTNDLVTRSGILESIENTSDLHKDTESQELYLVDNPLMIDILQASIPEDNIMSPLRYFCQSEYDYNLIDKNGTVLISGEEVRTANNNNPNGNHIKLWKIIHNYVPDNICLVDGMLIATVIFGDTTKTTDKFIEFKCYYYNNDIIYTSTKDKEGFRVRPNDTIINQYFESLSDFEKILLNQYTDYTARFDTYFEDEETGWYYVDKTYQWPTSLGGWNLSIAGVPYNIYLEDLHKLADGYDTLFCNAIWRTMTHDAVSNFDLTIKHNDDLDITSQSRLQQIIHVIGRQFDEIKKYADNIKNCNTITYEQDNNTPDYFLSDNLSMSGWEVKNILNGIDENIVTEPMYGARTIGYNTSDANNEFMRRLQLNSKPILSSKGTKKCIEDLMGVFGFHSIDWLTRYYGNNIQANDLAKAFIMIEYVYIANGYTNNKSAEDVLDNVRKFNQLKDNFSNEGINNEEYIDNYQGLPLVEVTIGDKTRLVPWFDKNKEYDSHLYFQMKGGWGGYDNNGKTIYDYSISQINYVKSIDDLYTLTYGFLHNNQVYYVQSTDKYYKLVNKENFQLPESWVLLTQEEVSQYINIVDNNKGNNPHTGEYDNGVSYLQAFNTLFKDATFENCRNDIVNENLSYGFNVIRQADSTKCLFYGNLYLGNTENVAPLRGKNKIKPYNFFDGDSYDEAASLSVINSKELHIIFDETYKDFIKNDVLFYLKQIIPSTTIFSYSFEKIEKDYEKTFQARTHLVACDNNTCPINGLA